MNQQLRAKEAVKIVSKIGNFQQLAELGFFTFPFAYYGTHVADFIIASDAFLTKHPNINRILSSGFLMAGTATAFRHELKLENAIRLCSKSVTQSSRTVTQFVLSKIEFTKQLAALTKYQLHEGTKNALSKTTAPIRSKFPKQKRGVKELGRD